MLPELCIAPHEIDGLPFGESLCAPADERVRVQSGPRAGDYLVRFIENVYRARTVVARRETSGSPLLYVHHSANLGYDTASKIAQGLFNRLLYFDGDARLSVALSTSIYHLAIYAGDAGDVIWSSRGHAEVNLRRFDRNPLWRCPLDWTFDTPDQQIERDINAMLRDPDSYFAIACDWNFSSEEQQSRRLARFDNGDFDEFKHRLRQLVLCFDELDANVEWTLSSRIYRQRDGESEAESLAHMLMDTQLSGKEERHRLSAFQARVFEEITRYFRPSWNLELNDLLIRHEIRSGQEINFPIQVLAPVASAHQRLEARLQLRDWLRDKVFAPEIAALLI